MPIEISIDLLRGLCMLAYLLYNYKCLQERPQPHINGIFFITFLYFDIQYKQFYLNIILYQGFW